MLIAPLDWGLGHATRCIPVIEKLLIAGFKVIMAAEGDQKILLQAAFPDLEIVHLSGYKLKYGSTKLQTLLKLIFQIPKILTAINRENKWLNSFVRTRPVDIIIADNRFGLYNSNCVSVFITHQLAIKTSLGKFADAVVQKLNYHFINQFDYCWVPDAAGAINLAGALSHPAVHPKTQIHYTGILSRIKKENSIENGRLLVLLSGPEPQRTILETILLKQLQQYPYPATVIRGLPSANTIVPVPAGVTIYNNLASLQLQQAINESGIIVCRSGYSTIMDVLPLGKRCILIPTPGQAEQEYLAAWLLEKKYVCVALQDKFSLPQMMENAKKLCIPDLSFLKDPHLLDETIAALLSRSDSNTSPQTA